MKFKNNQWDSIDPQLQNIYKQTVQTKNTNRMPQTLSSPQDQSNLQYVHPNLIDRTMNNNPLTGEAWKTSIPVQKPDTYLTKPDFPQKMQQSQLVNRINSSYDFSPASGNIWKSLSLPEILNQNTPENFRHRIQGDIYTGTEQNHTIPYPINDVRFEKNYSTLPSTQIDENQPLTNFKDGLVQYGKRLSNDFSYNLGKLKSWWNNEDDMQNAYRTALQNNGDFSSLSNEELKRQIDQTKREIYEKITHRPEKAPRWNDNELYDKETGATNEHDYLDKKNRYIDAIKSILEMRENGLSSEQIEQKLNDYIINGGEGKRQMREALEQNDNFKETQGWAKAAEIGAGITQQAIPIAAGLVFPPAGIAMGAANVGSMAAQSHAQAQMDIDRYEKENGEKVPDWKRAAYVGSYAGADLLIEGLMQGRYLNKLSAPLKETMRRGVISEMMKSPQASKELTDLLRNYKHINIGKLAREVGSDAAMEGLSEAGTSVAQDMAARIYTDRENYPALNDILQNATRAGVEGGILGGALGGISHTGGKAIQQLRRKNKGIITILNTKYGEPMEVLGQTENGMYRVLTPEGKEQLVYPDFAESIYSIPYDDYNRISSTGAKEYDRMPPAWEKDKNLRGADPGFRTSISFVNPNSPWLNKEDTPFQRSRRRQEAEKISEELGIDTQIYDRQSELPIEIQKNLSTKDIMPGYFSPEDNQVNIILDNIHSEAELRKTLMREAVSKKGIRALYGDHTDDFLDQVFRSMSPETQDVYKKNNRSNRKAAEEYLSDIAEKGVDNPGLWNNIQSYTRQIMRNKMGKEFDLNDKELQYILWKARNRITNKDSMKEMRDKNNREQQIRKSMFPTQYPPKK